MEIDHEIMDDFSQDHAQFLMRQVCIIFGKNGDIGNRCCLKRKPHGMICGRDTHEASSSLCHIITSGIV